MELYGVRIPTIITENVAVRCAGCGGIVRGTPWRVSILDVVSPESPVSWAETAPINPGPFEFHADAGHVLAWMAQRGMLFCRRSQVREIMRPVWLPGDPRRLGLCDGIHRDDHEFVHPGAFVGPQGPVGEARPSAMEAAAAEAEARGPEAKPAPSETTRPGPEAKPG